MPFPLDTERGVFPRKQTPPSSPNRSPFPSPLKDVDLTGMDDKMVLESIDSKMAGLSTADKAEPKGGAKRKFEN